MRYRLQIDGKECKDGFKVEHGQLTMEREVVDGEMIVVTALDDEKRTGRFDYYLAKATPARQLLLFDRSNSGGREFTEAELAELFGPKAEEEE